MAAGLVSPLAAASLVAAAVNDAVFAIGTRAAARTAAESLEASGLGGAAAAGGAEGAGGDAGGGGAVSRSSTAGSSSVSSIGPSGAFALCSVAFTTGIAVEACPGARNISGSMKFSPVCSGSVGLPGSAGAAAEGCFAPPDSLRGLSDSSGSSTGKTGRASRGGRDAASIGETYLSNSGRCTAPGWLTHRCGACSVRDAVHSRCARRADVRCASTPLPRASGSALACRAAQKELDLVAIGA